MEKEPFENCHRLNAAYYLLDYSSEIKQTHFHKEELRKE